MSQKGKEIMNNDTMTGKNNPTKEWIDMNKKLFDSDDDVSGGDLMITTKLARKRVAENEGLDHGRDVSPPPGFTRAHRFARLKTSTEKEEMRKQQEIIRQFIDLGDDDDDDDVNCNATTIQQLPMALRQEVPLVIPPLRQRKPDSLVGMNPFAPQEWGQSSQAEILALPPSSSNNSVVTTVFNSLAIKDFPFKHIRRKVGYLLCKDYQQLVDSGDMTELVRLSRILQEDKTLNADQLALLKVVEEIPIVIKNYEELKELPKQIKQLSDKLESDMSSAFDMKKKYNHITTAVSKVQAELKADTSALEVIDNQIMRLQRRRFELFSSANAKRTTISDLEKSKRETADALAKILDDVELGKKKKQASEDRNKIVGDNHAAILARCAKYKGVPFTLFLP